jgi:hypothetical protein
MSYNNVQKGAIMSVFEQVLNWGPFSRTRRNHALEHATLQVLAEKLPHLKAAGYSDPQGFWLIGDLQTQQVEEAVGQASARLQGGEHSLAIHPHCGTNLVTTGFLAGSFAWLGMLGAGRTWRDRFERWPVVVTLVTLAMVVAQPLGPYLQQRVTTSAATQGLQIVNIQRTLRGEMPVHRVVTRYL